MKAKEFILEKAVQSSWIVDISYNRPNRIITMRLSNGKAFSIRGITRSQFEKWTSSPSKGRYFHDRIKDNYQIARIK